MSKQIAVTINAMGDRPKVEAIGFAGQGCAEATKGLEMKLAGDEIGAKDWKPEVNDVDVEENETETLSW